MVASKSAFGQIVDAAHDRDARVVDEDVDRAERRSGAIHHRLDGSGLRYIGGDGNRAAALRLDLRHDGVRIRGALPVIHGNRGAGIGERRGDRGADAARCPRHQRYMAGQIEFES